MSSFLKDHRHRDFFRLWWAQLISQFGDRLHQMALIGWAAHRAPGSAWGLAKILAFTIIPVFLVGPVAGAFVDRWDRRAVLWRVDVIRGILVLLMITVFWDKNVVWPIYGVVFVIFCLSRFYVPAKMALIPDLVDKTAVLTANSWITTTGMVAFVLGASLGGWIVEHFGARGGLVGDALTYFLSAALILSIKRDLSWRLNSRRLLVEGRRLIRQERSVWQDILQGLVYLWRRREIRVVLALLFLSLSAAGAVYVSAIVFIQQTFASVTKDLGLLAIPLGLGLLFGVVGYTRLGVRVPWYRTLFFCLGCGGILLALFAWCVGSAANLLIAAIMAFGLGVVLGPMFIVSNTVVHWVCDETMRGKVFTAVEMVIHAAFLLAMFISAGLTERMTPQVFLIGVGLFYGGLGLTGFVFFYHGRGLAQQGRDMA